VPERIEAGLRLRLQKESPGFWCASRDEDEQE